MADEKNQVPCWYVVHTYAGYENKVKDTLLKAVVNNNMQDLIFDVRVPLEEVEEIRGGRRVKSQRKVYPSYVLVHMINTTKSWYVVRNTRGVTGFVGPDSQPIALTDVEVETMLSTQEKSVEFNIAIGEEVRILTGPLENFVGVVEDVDTVRQLLKVRVNNFMGKSVAVEYALDQVARVQQ
ncbi:MAG: transcription termination/antitermination protein NusG [Eubacteriales bacterium]|nr:transcription termination/antitermination protein NusG [Eubacteriales bacterium]